ncbi:MAG: methyl-accepting chemotaxis protein [Pseudomonadales bacterium]|nr:methyl-accepting chemotaxis protein [Pseudomonadales bacterium]
MADRSPNLISSISHNPLHAALVGLLVLSVLGFGTNSYYVIRDTERDKERLEYANRIRVLSQQIAKDANAAAQGNSAVFPSLQVAVREFELNYSYLVDGNLETNLLPLAEIQGELEEINKSWIKMEASVGGILGNKDALSYLDQISLELAETVPAIQQENGKVVATLLRAGTTANQIALIQKQAFLIERMHHGVDRVLEMGTNENLVNSFSRDSKVFREVLDGLITGDRTLLLNAVKDTKSIESLTTIDELFRSISGQLDLILARSADVVTVKRAAEDIFAESRNLLVAADALIAKYRSMSDSRPLSANTAVILGSLSFFIIVVISFLLFREARDRLVATALEVQRNQAAIFRLLDELADLGDGDLTVQAAVTESFTSAIADSINVSFDQMRELVSKINETTGVVSGAAQGTQMTVNKLAEASERQFNEITDVSGSVDGLAVSIDRVSTNAAESTAVAERSVEIANKGAEVVQNTINGMDQIRGQIQETSKRIKRLGESSQEIGDIVSLINDIADQTNILSLNAAIQASMAGDAGRGFAVVADEVQRLAERSGAAAKQITALVQTIQSDTNEAVISMAQTTSEVVEGTRLAQDAGVALGEIESVSKSLAEIIESISKAARQQTASAGTISDSMKSIQEITSQTTEGTKSTATAVGNLAKMTNELRSSVSRFKIPE